MASLEFAVPGRPFWRFWWWGYTRLVLPLAGGLLGGRAWFDVGRFLGPNIEWHYRRFPVEANVRRMGGRRHGGRGRAPDEPRWRSGDVGSARAVRATGPLAPAFYAVPDVGPRRAWTDWWVLLHPPYTLWHLSYVAIGAAPRAHARRRTARRHAGRVLPRRRRRRARARRAPRSPLATTDPCRGAGRPPRCSASPVPWRWAIVGMFRGRSRARRLHRGRRGAQLRLQPRARSAGGCTTTSRSRSRGARSRCSPRTTRRPSRFRPVAFLAAGAAFFLSMAQRSLSTTARHLRRRVASVEGSMVDHDGNATPISRTSLLRPIEGALQSMAWGIVALAVALVVYRTTT